jgi:homoserine dehydrogenase
MRSLHTRERTAVEFNLVRHCRISLIVLGVGGVGRALIRRIVESRDFHRSRYGLELDFLALVDSSGGLSRAGAPLADQVLGEALEWKKAGRPLAEFPGGGPDREKLARSLLAKGTILVDCSASDETIELLEDALAAGGGVVLANKKPLTASLRFFDLLASKPDSCRWETTVGSCLPVIAAINRIVASGDEVRRISGTFSGTLGLLMTRLQESIPFSRTIRQAYEAGFTEPDPREDLSGVDVARKSLILARGIGWALNMEDVSVQGVLPGPFEESSVEGFLTAISALDEYYSVRVRSAQKHGNVLRYLADIGNGRCRVGPGEVPLDSPLGRLRGNDNLVQIYSGVYDPQPLLLQGRGGGAAATAAGVLSDILELALGFRTPA